MSNNRKKVFISYAREDQETAKKLYSDLKNKGLIPWMDCEDLLPGQKWEIMTRKAIRESSFFLTLLSANSLSKKGFVHRELKLALDILEELPSSEVFLIPVRLEECQPAEEELQKLHFVDLFPDYETGLKQLLRVIPPSPTNWDKIFVGREKLVKNLVYTKGSFFIFGARRIGKTALLKFVENKYWEKDIPGFYISIQGFMEAEKIKRKIRNCFRKKKFTDHDTLFKEYSFFDFLEELDLNLTGRIFFLIDEAEQIAEIEKKEKGFIDKFRNSVESLDNVRFVLTASPHFKKVIAMPDCSCSAFLSAFDEIDVLPVMTSEETSELIQKLVPEIKDEEINQILDYTHFQPYLVKIFIRKLLKNGTINEPSQSIALDTYIANALDGIMPNYFAGLNDDYQDIVHQIHRKRFEYKKEYETELRELTQYGYLKYEAGEYKISNWFFKHWLNEEFGAVNNN